MTQVWQARRQNLTHFLDISMENSTDKFHNAKQELSIGYWGPDGPKKPYPDIDVFAALKHVVVLSTPVDRPRLRPAMLKGVVRKHINPVIDSWFKKHDLGIEWKFSDFLEYEAGYGQGILQVLARRVRMRNEVRAEDFSATCDVLINFLFFLGALAPLNVKVVRFRPPRGSTEYDSANERVAWGHARNKKASHGADEIPGYIKMIREQLRSGKLCLACGLPTSAREERIRLINARIDSAIKDDLRRGIPFTPVEEVSYDYCSKHSVDNTALRRAKRQSLRFMTVLFSFCRREVKPTLNGFIHPDREYEFAREIISDRNCHANLRKIEENVPLVFNRSKEVSRTAGSNLAELIYDLYINILKWKPEPFDAEAYLATKTTRVEDGITYIDFNASKKHPP
jgi:hypothetical protein